jgi:hypothetical protein
MVYLIGEGKQTDRSPGHFHHSTESRPRLCGVLAMRRRGNLGLRATGDVRLKVLYTKSNDLREARARIRTISDEGLFLETRELFEVNALLDLDIHITEDIHVNILGVIIGSRPDEGIGVEFFPGSEEEALELKRKLGRWKERTLKN